jgi:hypothetical protein
MSDDPAKTEDRINSLLAKSEAASAQAESAAASNALLTQRLARLEETLSGISRPRTPEAPPKAAPTDKVAGTDIAEMVKGIVQEALSPLVQEHQERTAREARAAKHNAAFAKAISENPELADTASPLRKTADRIWEGRPDLQVLDDAPLIVANLARSFLVTEKSIEQTKTEVKRQAGVTRPAPVTQRTQYTESETDRAISDARESAATAGVGPGAGPRTFTNLFRASLTEALKKAE